MSAVAQLVAVHYAWSEDDAICGPLLSQCREWTDNPREASCLKCLAMLADEPEYADVHEYCVPEGPLPHQPQDVTTFTGSTRAILEAIADSRDLGEEVPPWKVYRASELASFKILYGHRWWKGIARVSA